MSVTSQLMLSTLTCTLILSQYILLEQGDNRLKSAIDLSQYCFVQQAGH